MRETRNLVRGLIPLSALHRKVSVCILSLLAAGCVFIPRGEETAFRASDMQNWQWTDDAGRSVRLSDFRGEIVVLSMFYEGCANTCPLTLFRMQALAQAFEKRGLPGRFVLVTLDPRHDTPERLSSYRARHRLNPERWVLLRGEDEQTLALSRALGMHRIDDSSHIIHIGKIVAISADGAGMHAVEGQQVEDVMAFEPRTSRYR